MNRGSIINRAATAVVGRVFNHRIAQAYEIQSAMRTMRRSYPAVFEGWSKGRAKGSLAVGPDDDWFRGDKALFDAFAAHVIDRTCLEVGAGPFGYLINCHGIADRHIIDPLSERYRDYQIRLNGRSVHEGMTLHAIPAEQRVEALVGKVDGFILSRNAMDHADDPLTILTRLGEYAAPGCYLLLSTDIWHLQGVTIGHRNITRSPEAIGACIRGMGFEIVAPTAPIRKPDEFIEFGCVAVKR